MSAQTPSPINPSLESAFFDRHSLAVFAHLSSDSKRRLEAYAADGNREFRRQRLLDFFRTLDWIAPGDDVDDRLLGRLENDLRLQLLKEIEGYRMQQNAKKLENAQKREAYRLRVFEYFRIKMPPQDKILLESLRDYELDLTGRDVNWRHYFTLDSFRKIDEFIHADSQARKALFSRFRQDVDTYCRNVDKLNRMQEAARQAADRGVAFNFDDWCETTDDDFFRHQSKQQGQGNGVSSPAGGSLEKAYATLEVPIGASPAAVKKSFRRLTLQHHPDLPSGCAETMKTIVAAYQRVCAAFDVMAT